MMQSEHISYDTRALARVSEETIVPHVNDLADKLRSTDGNGFYPYDMSGHEVQRVSLGRPLVRHPFTKVAHQSGRWTASDYRIAYPGEFDGIARGYQTAATMVENPDLIDLLYRTRDVLKDPSIPFEEVYALLVKSADLPTLPILGTEEYFDANKLKSVLVYWLSERNPASTDRWQSYIDSAVNSYVAQFHLTHNPSVRLRLGTWLIPSHIVGVEEGWSANTQPNFKDWLIKYGAMIHFDEIAAGDKFRNGRLQAIRKYIHPDMHGSLSNTDLADADWRALMLHEALHPLAKLLAKGHLGDLDLVVHEAYPSTMATVLSEEVDRDKTGLLVIALLGSMFNDFFNKKLDPKSDDYIRGYSSLFGYWLSAGVAELRDNTLYAPNMRRITRATQDFASLLGEILVTGDQNRANQLVAKYESTGRDGFYEIARRQGSHKNGETYISPPLPV